MARHTGDECLRCETQGRLPGKGVLPVKVNGVEGFICTQCVKELQEEGHLYYEDEEN